MKFLADEGVDKPIVIALREAGFDIDYILESHPVLMMKRSYKLQTHKRESFLLRIKILGNWFSGSNNHTPVLFLYVLKDIRRIAKHKQLKIFYQLIRMN